jgi:hypothetical protein
MTKRARTNISLGLIILGSLEIIFQIGFATPARQPDMSGLLFGGAVIILGIAGYFMERRRGG